MSETRGPKRKQATREEFARLMEITHQDVTKLVLKGVLTRGAPIGQWLVEYGRHMKKVAAGWQSDAGFDLIGERDWPRCRPTTLHWMSRGNAATLFPKRRW